MAGEIRADAETRRMHQTTLRFAPDLWDALSHEAGLAGVSVAQYVREAVLTRIVYAAARRGDPLFESALKVVGVEEEAVPPASVRSARQAAETSEQALEGTAGVWAQSKQARARARELREAAHAAKAKRHAAEESR